MKAIPNENFLTGSERQGSEKEGEGEVEKKRGEVSLRAIPGHYQAPRYLMRILSRSQNMFSLLGIALDIADMGRDLHGSVRFRPQAAVYRAVQRGLKTKKLWKKWSIELLTFDRKVIGRVTIPRNDPV